MRAPRHSIDCAIETSVAVRPVCDCGLNEVERLRAERDEARDLLRLCQPWIAHLHARDVADRVRALLDGAA